MQLQTGTVAMVLAGGRVDDLGPLTFYRPKSAMPFGGFARIIDFPLSNLMHSGLSRVGILSQYHSYSLINHIGIGASWDMTGSNRSISILPPFQGSQDTSWYLGSADAVYQNLDFIRYHDPENVLILSGDHVYNMDYGEIIGFHQEQRADLTIAFVKTPRESAGRFGMAEIDEEGGSEGGKVLSYEEKTALPKGEWASMTIYCFKPEILYRALDANAAENDSHEFGRDIIPRLLAEKRRVYGYKFAGYWGYARSVDEYRQTNMDLLGPNPVIPLRQWNLRTNLDHRRLRDRPPLKLGRESAVANSLIYNGCTIEGEVENSIIFPGVRVGKGSKVRNSIIFFDNEISEECRLNRVISDIGNTFERGCAIGGHVTKPADSGKITVLGRKNRIPAETLIESGFVLFPEMPTEEIPLILGKQKVRT